MSPGVAAFIWDFDGTLADTRLRNYSVVRRLLGERAATPLDAFPALVSADIYDRIQRRYPNWRELYLREFGFSEAETDHLGGLWGDYQRRDETPVEVFAGIAEVLAALAAVRHGIVSQNAREEIRRTLERAGIAAHFRAIVGYDNVHLARQKPEPDGFLACLDQLEAAAPGQVLYIGDHETDVRCARNAQRTLAERGTDLQVVSIAAAFDGRDEHGAWAVQADYVAHTPTEILSIAREFGFES